MENQDQAGQVLETGTAEYVMTNSWENLKERHALTDPINVTRPSLPDLEEYTQILRRIWDSHWLTNAGAVHQELESRIGSYLDAEHVSLFCNGTIALLVAFKALDIEDGEVITTPFTFPATPHALHWNGVTPVFADIDPDTFNLDPNEIEKHITAQTRAILPVHVFGVPCDFDAFQAIGDRHGLPVVYDAAHAFGVRLRGRSITQFGDMSVFSFHATKLFSTAEGGAIVVRSKEMKANVDFLKNFGIADEETIIGVGINGKMNELVAALGLLQIDKVEDEIRSRARIADVYNRELAGIPGLRIPIQDQDVEYNYAYYPVLIDPEQFGANRDEVHSLLRECNVYTRKYFYPLCSRYSCYDHLPSASPENLPVAERIVSRILCLPIYGDLDPANVGDICSLLKGIHKSNTDETQSPVGRTQHAAEEQRGD